MESLVSGAAVCCMCGDHGLPRELFRCGHCHHRLQHRYCSELYPRVAAYRRCNWCLREGRRRGGGGGTPVTAAAAAAKQRMSAALETSTDDCNKVDKSSRRSCGDGGCSRSAFCAEPGKPVKKPKAAASDDDGGPVVVMPVDETAATAPLERKPPARKARFRVKVRRYKLLAEVLSC
uniref:PHD-type zinc finger plants domain-containing protein n=1 Tax=Oryza meridionalis TaxID=40149 RepID=A0A0E0CM83_9ORYZ